MVTKNREKHDLAIYLHLEFVTIWPKTLNNHSRQYRNLPHTVLSSNISLKFLNQINADFARVENLNQWQRHMFSSIEYAFIYWKYRPIREDTFYSVKANKLQLVKNATNNQRHYEHWLWFCISNYSRVNEWPGNKSHERKAQNCMSVSLALAIWWGQQLYLRHFTLALYWQFVDILLNPGALKAKEVC